MEKVEKKDSGVLGFIGQLGNPNFQKSSLNDFSKHLSSELKCACYCVLSNFNRKLDFDQKTIGLHKPNLWQDLETESYAPEKWVLSHYRWREAFLFLFSFEYESPRTWAALNFLGLGKLSQLPHSS